MRANVLDTWCGAVLSVQRALPRELLLGVRRRAGGGLMDEQQWVTLKPIPVSDVDLVFPTSVERYLPPYSLTTEFHRKNDWTNLAERWFFHGLPKEVEFELADGIDSNLAVRHIQYCLSSWEPKHEAKIAGVAYLMSRWFKTVTTQDRTYGAEVAR